MAVWSAAWAGASSEAAVTAAAETVEKIRRQNRRVPSGQTMVGEAETRKRRPRSWMGRGRKTVEPTAKRAKRVEAKMESSRGDESVERGAEAQERKSERRKKRIPVVVGCWGEVLTVLVASCD